MTLKRSLKVIQINAIRKLGFGFLFAFYSNYGSLLHHLRDKARYWSKIVIFSYPFAFDAPFRGFLSEYCHSVWYEKTRMVELTDGEIFLRMCITVYNQYRRVTDRQTDGQTDILHSPRYAYASRGKSAVLAYITIP